MTNSSITKTPNRYACAIIISAALMEVARRCDGAHAQDGVGFSQADVGLGHYLANLPAKDWQPEHLAVAGVMCRTYRKQLQVAGFDVEDLPLPSDSENRDVRESARGFMQKRREELRQVERNRWYEKREREKEEAQKLAEERSGLWLTDGKLELLTPGFNAERVDAVKAIPSRHWNGYSDTFSLVDIEAVEAVCARFGLPVRITAEQRQEMQGAIAAAKAAAEAKAREPQVFVEDKKVFFKFDYNAEIVSAVKSAGARWDGNNKLWYMNAKYLDEALTIAKRTGLRIAPELQQQADDAEHAANEKAQASTTERAAAKAAQADQTAVQVDGITTELMAHQSTPVRMLQATMRLLLADAPGLGKSLSAISSINYTARQRSVIVCPASLTGNWQAEFEKHTDGSRIVWVMTGTKSQPVPEGVDVVIVGWPILSDRLDDLKAWKPDAVIVDEAHYGKSGKESARAEASKALCGSVAANKGMVLLMTGTPVVNRPVELLPLLESLGVIEQFGGKRHFLHHFCGPRYQTVYGGRRQIIYDGATNTEELHNLLGESGYYLRRTKADLVKAGQMGNKFVNGISALDLATDRQPDGLVLTKPELAPYHQAVEAFTAWLETELHTKGASEAEIKRRVASAAESILPRIGALRQVLAKVKLPYVIKRAQELIEQGEQVVVVAHHREVVDALTEALKAEKIQGGMDIKQIEAGKDRFNRRQTMAMVLSMESGKTGHTLCSQRLLGAGPECCHMIIAEESWAPGDEEQAQDRLWRLGQSRDVIVTNMTVPDTLDDGIWQLREQKRKIVAAVTDGTALDEGRLQVASFLTSYILGYK